MKTKANKQRVIITKPIMGICGMQVCAIATVKDKEILEICNRENPSGTTNGWGTVIRRVKKDELFHIKENLPVTCLDDPTRKHFIVLC
jgi:hypothetical protein